MDRRLHLQRDLSRWADPAEDFLAHLDNTDPALETLTLGRPQPPAYASTAGPGAAPKPAQRMPGINPLFFEETGPDHDFGQGFDDLLGLPSSGKPSTIKPLPASMVSPARRRSLSEFSEATDTDITELNDDDFDGIDDVFGKEDDIFGKEESGIYSLGGSRASQANTKARHALERNRKQLQEAADAEDREMYRRYRAQMEAGPASGSTNTLRLRDLRQLQQAQRHDGSPPGAKHRDSLSADRTVNYEYTKDDFENFEDGFADLDIQPACLRPFQAKLPRKASMPVFPKLLKAQKPRFKSTMDLGLLKRDSHTDYRMGSFRSARNADDAHRPGLSVLSEDLQHPRFNDHNDLVRKLARMPSFQREPLSDDVLDYNMEMKKKQLLEKFMEITEKQIQLRSSPRKTTARQAPRPQKPRKGVGLVKYLNLAGSGAPATDDKMHFNPALKVWEGNDHDLLRFEERAEHKQPSLITLADFKQQSRSGRGASNMQYDPDNLKWVNLEKEDDVFGDLPDLEPNDVPRYVDRGVSTFTQRTTLTSTTASSGGDEFQLTPRLLDKFEKEEAKIRKKTHHWFAPNETYHVHRGREHTREYLWDIRKMVMDS